MGRWSTTIMGGDTPLDIQGGIYDHCAVKMYKSDRSVNRTLIPKATLEKEQANILKSKKLKEYQDSYSQDVPLVLGVMMMEVGAKMTPATKKVILTAAKGDIWAIEDKERKGYVKEYIKAIEKYDGKTPVTITEEGLFEAIGKHLASGKEGLVNK